MLDKNKILEVIRKRSEYEELLTIDTDCNSLAFNRKIVGNNKILRKWFSDLQYHLEKVETNPLVSSIIELTNIFDGWHDEDNFTLLLSKLETLDENFEEVFSEIKADSPVPHNSKEKAKIFIVHGHDEELKQTVARFLEHLNLTPIILHEQANAGLTIIEKIEAHTNVSFGIVLYTPCDRGGLNSKDSKLSPRARQNVVFEHGYLTAKLGRHKVAALLKTDVEVVGDNAGVLYITIDGSLDWKYKLVDELIASGISVDKNDIK